jgi:hypothetical protein
VIECLQVGQYKYKKALKKSGLLTPEIESEIYSSFWIERTSSVRALEHYLRFNLLFKRFVISCSDDLFSEAMKVIVPICENDNEEDACSCIHDLIAEVEILDLKSLGKGFSCCFS